MNYRILVVEDSPTQALKTQLLLEDAGYLVEMAENGQIGLEKVLTNPPDLVVADIVMPVMDGYEMTSQLKSDFRTANIPVIMLTTKDQPLDIIHGLEVGADHFITKPPDDSLVQRIQAFFHYREGMVTGYLPERQQLQHFCKEIVITESREQILQSLLKSTARIVKCQVMAILLDTMDGRLNLFVLSFQSLDDDAVEHLWKRMSNLLSLLRVESSVPTVVQKMCIVVEPKASPSVSQGDLLSSFLEVPLIVDSRVVGLMGAFSAEKEAFDIKHVRFLFDMGQKAATALSRIKMGGHREA